MVSKKSRNSMREMRHARIRRQLHGTEAAPRLSVFRSNTGIYAQIIDDDNKKTLVLMETHHIVMDGTSLNNFIISLSIYISLPKYKFTGI